MRKILEIRLNPARSEFTERSLSRKQRAVSFDRYRQTETGKPPGHSGPTGALLEQRKQGCPQQALAGCVPGNEVVEYGVAAAFYKPVEFVEQGGHLRGNRIDTFGVFRLRRLNPVDWPAVFDLAGEIGFRLGGEQLGKQQGRYGRYRVQGSRCSGG